MMMEKLLIEEQIIKRWHQKTITRPSPIDLHPSKLHNEILILSAYTLAHLVSANRGFAPHFALHPIFAVGGIL